MPKAKQKTVAVCFDGTDLSQLNWIRRHLPALDELFETGRACKLSAAPFVDPQPIWAEILTGTPWYENGCAGFAKPVGSLNNMQIFQEHDLRKPIRLWKQTTEGQSVVINVPLLQPDSERIWLSDGSLPSQRNFAPESLLLAHPILSQYTPRPFLSMGDAMADTFLAVTEFVDAEKKRLECVKSIVSSTDWTFLLYRTSILDQLFHLLGEELQFIEKLRTAKVLHDLFKCIDETLTPLMMQAENLVAFSTFSHTKCRALFSLNNAFEDARLLSRKPKQAEAATLRMQALSATRDEETSAKPVQLTESFEYEAKRTLCASPSRSAIYINGNDKFADGGKIDADILDFEEERVAAFFTSTTSNYFANVTLVKNPKQQSQAPNFCFQIDGVELVEYLPGVVQTLDLPRSTHAPSGWLWSRKVDNSKQICRSIDVANFII